MRNKNKSSVADYTAAQRFDKWSAAMETVKNMEKAKEVNLLLKGEHALSAAYEKVAKTHSRREANRFLRQRQK